jgi:hypothetical protein
MDITEQKETRISYFDVLKGSLSLKQSMTTSITIAGTFMPSSDRVEYTSQFQRLFRSIQSESNRITGILLVYKSSFIHVIELPRQFASTFLNEVARNQNTESARMVLFMDDCERMFPFWASRLLEQENHQEVHEVNDDVISLTAMDLFRIGQSLSELQKVRVA